jgi:inosine-uridine nucleoside N-ribohydrolase
MSTKVLLDTDIGSDIDDAVALAWLLANPDCELLGITTVTGEARIRAQLASVLCRAAGKRIPIFPGAEAPLLIGQRQKQAPQAAALERWSHEESFPEGGAVGFLRETIRAHPGEVVLLTIGPLTNIALLFALDPDIPGLLKGLMMMCGIFSNKAAGFGPLEWNAMLDPHATAIVYHHAVALHRSIGLDVTSQVTLEAEEVRRRFQAPLLRPVLEFSEVWFRHSGSIIFHDPLAAVSLFHPSVCAFEKGTVEVELASQQLAGATLWTPSAAGTHEVAFEVNRTLFFDRYFSVFL